MSSYILSDYFTHELKNKVLTGSFFIQMKKDKQLYDEYVESLYSFLKINSNIITVKHKFCVRKRTRQQLR